MPHPISTLGAAHTAISLLPVVAGLYSFARYRGIFRQTTAGKIYLGSLVLSVFTAFGLSSTGGFNAGHALGILTLLALLAAHLVGHLRPLARVQSYLSQFAYSFTFFLLLVPGLNETLTRLPAAPPLAASPESPVVKTALATWLVIFVIGSVLQLWWIRAQRKSTVSA